MRSRRIDSNGLERFRNASEQQQRRELEAACRALLERNWVAAPGFTVPNRKKYPWQWLWDSCFHAIAWSGLGDARCVTELETLLALQLPSGFIPHMGYQTDPQRSLALWRNPGRSDITQPPMYGHALSVLARRGFEVDHLHGPATAGLHYLFEHRRDPNSGLIRVLHPWETGCDDSPRWGGSQSAPFKERPWNKKKRELVRSLQVRDGAACENPGFDVGSAGFSALVAFNARELAQATGNEELLGSASELADALDARWVATSRTWSDVCLAGPVGSSTVRTLDPLFAVLASASDANVDAAFEEILDVHSFWRPFGPASIAADEPSYDPRAYWRGDAWPQEIYLLMVAAQQRGRGEQACLLAEKLILGCIGSRYSERWNPETGARLGASPQGWAALAVEGIPLLADASRRPC